MIEDDAEFVSYIYHSILGREADSGGHAYWLAALAEGTSRAELVDIFLIAARNDPRDAAYVDNRVYVASQFAEWRNSNPEMLADLKFNAGEVLEGVNEDPASIAQAESRLDENRPTPPLPPGPEPEIPQPEPQTFLLTPDVDELTGSSTNDVFMAPLRADGSAPVASLQTFDTLNGGAGDDILEADLHRGTAAPTLASIETLRLYNSAHEQGATLDLAQATGHRHIDILSSQGGILIQNTGDIESLSVAGAQRGVIVLEGITSRTLALDLVALSNPASDWAEIWLGDDESTYAEDGPYLLSLDVLDLKIANNSDGVFLRNVAADVLAIDVEGDNVVRVEGIASEEVRITGAGSLWLGEALGIVYLNGEYLRLLDTSGFDGRLQGVAIGYADHPDFQNAVIRLGEGRQTLSFETAIADGVQISGGSRADSWTTLQLTQLAYDSLAGFDDGSVSNIDALTLIDMAREGTYELLHGSTAFTFAGGIESGATVTLNVRDVLAPIINIGQAPGGNGNLMIASDGVLDELALRVGGSDSDTAATIEIAAETLMIEVGQGGSGGAPYSLTLRDIALADDPAGSIKSIELSGDRWVWLDLTQSELGSGLRSIDASGNSGGVDLTLGEFSGIDITASQYWDSFILDTTANAAAPLNTLFGVGSDDLVMLQLDGHFAAGPSFGEILFADNPDDLDAALQLAYSQLDTTAGGRAGWFVYGEMTYFLAKEGTGIDTQYVALEVEGTGLSFDFLNGGSAAEVWFY